MRVVFFGTPDFAVPTLRALRAAGHELVGVVTQPDRARGRSRSTLQPPPVKVAALEAGLPVLQPERPVGDVFERTLRDLAPDIGIVVAYGHILRPHVLAIPRLGMLNVHASLLPRWRGAAPIQWAILEDDAETGVAVMRMEAGLDTGPVYAEARTPIGPEETAGELLPRLAELGAATLAAVLPAIADGVRRAVPQATEGVTYAHKVDRALARLDLRAPARRVAARIRAFDPAPGAWATLDDEELKLFGAAVIPRPPGALGTTPGACLLLQDPTRDAAEPRLLIRAGDGAAVAVRTVQPAGRARMPAGDFVRGRAAQLDGAVLA